MEWNGHLGLHLYLYLELRYLGVYLFTLPFYNEYLFTGVSGLEVWLYVGSFWWG